MPRVVADISPFLESLRQFTPRAQEDRAIQLEALGQQSQIRDLQLQTAERTAKRQQATDLATENRVDILEDISDLDFAIEGDIGGLKNRLTKVYAESVAKNETHDNLESLIQMINLATTDPEEALNKVKAGREQAGRALSLVDKILGKTEKTAAGSEQRFFESLTSELTPEQQKKAGLVELGLESRAVGTGAGTIAKEGLTEIVAASQGIIEEAVAGAKVTGAAKAKAKLAPLIAKTEAFITTQVKLAESAAKERGEVLTDLARMEATLPGLTEVVGKLKELAKIATSTVGGRVFDIASKEFGFGATKGATARTKFGAMVSNQILPLLKPTFGGSFSVQEGDELRGTMGDKDLSIDEKLATLEAFMDQKERDIRGKKLQRDAGSSAEVTTRLVFNPATGQLEPK